MYPLKKILYYVLLAALVTTSFQCSDDDSDSPAKSSNKSILSFKFTLLNPAFTYSINEDAKTIAINAPAGTNVKVLLPIIEISEGAAVSPASEVVQDFTNPVVYTVTAEDGSKQAYTVTVTVAKGEDELTCYPVNLPGGEALMTVSYNADNTVATVDYQANNEESDTDYLSEFAYTSGKLTRINNKRSNEIVSYTTFAYGTNTITESFYEDQDENGVFEKINYYIYYLDGSRIKSWAMYENGSEASRLDSVILTYTNDNVTRQDGYGSGKTLVRYSLYQYDNKSNPYSFVGLVGDDDHFFQPLSISKNNITHIESYENEETDEVTVTYTYFDNGFPETRTVDDGPIDSFSYACY